jgi:hypothetical protein
MKGTLINVCAPVAELIEGHSSELKLYEISCRFSKALLLRCHLPIGFCWELGSNWPQTVSEGQSHQASLVASAEQNT